MFYTYPPHGADGLRELAAVLREGSRGELVFVTPPVLAVTLDRTFRGEIHGLSLRFRSARGLSAL